MQINVQCSVHDPWAETCRDLFLEFLQEIVNLKTEKQSNGSVMADFAPKSG